VQQEDFLHVRDLDTRIQRIWELLARHREYHVGERGTHPGRTLDLQERVETAVSPLFDLSQ
jgi:hypothetical protein